jgi:hypothetical protein
MGKKKDGDSESSTYAEPYVRKDPALFPPPPKTKRYEPGTVPEPKSITEAAPQEPETPERAAGPFVPDTTGIDTSRFPKPPARHDVASSPVNSTSKPKPPTLPPRLPPRTARATPPITNKLPTSATSNLNDEGAPDGILNQGALNRLGRAGIAVPGFDIGSKGTPSTPPRTHFPSPGSPSGQGAQAGELQTHFSRLTTSSAASNSSSPGTTWAEKQAALKTANNLKKDPSSVSLKDIRSAASTAKSFQARHGEQVASGVQSANQMNQKYGLADRMNKLSASSSSSTAPRDAVAGLKAPPPLPAKKRVLQDVPPPIPLSTKPQP